MTGNFHDDLRAGFASGQTCFVLPNGSEITYGDLAAAVDGAAGRLRAEGVGPGDRVVLVCEKSWEVVAIYLATLKIGGVFVPLNPAYTQSELDYFLGDCRPRVVVRDAEAFVAGAAGRGAGGLGDASTWACSPTHAASIIYTSGTTGRPKGAILTHGGLRANAEALQAAWGFSASDVLLHALPVFHVHGLFIALHCALLGGSPMLWLPRFDEAEVLAGLRRATVLMGVDVTPVSHPVVTRVLG